MRRRETMAAGGLTLAGLGALVGIAIGSGNGGQRLIAQQAQPVEVRTQIIRRTINIYRREHPHRTGANGPGAQSASVAPGTGGGSVATPAAPEGRAMSTRSSGSRGFGSNAPATYAPQPVSTRTSGGGGSGYSPSGGGRGDDGNGGGQGD